MAQYLQRTFHVVRHQFLLAQIDTLLSLSQRWVNFHFPISLDSWPSISLLALFQFYTFLSFPIWVWFGLKRENEGLDWWWWKWWLQIGSKVVEGSDRQWRLVMEVEKDRLSSMEMEINGDGWVLWFWVAVASWAQRWWVDLDFLAIGGVWRWWIGGVFSWSTIVWCLVGWVRLRCFSVLVEMLCFGIFVIVGFWSHLKIAVCFACLVTKKMQEEKQWENI